MILDAESYPSSTQPKVIPFLPVGGIWAPLLSKPTVLDVQGFHPTTAATPQWVSIYRIGSEVKPNSLSKSFSKPASKQMWNFYEKEANMYISVFLHLHLFIHSVSLLKNNDLTSYPFLIACWFHLTPDIHLAFQRILHHLRCFVIMSPVWTEMNGSVKGLRNVWKINGHWWRSLYTHNIHVIHI